MSKMQSVSSKKFRPHQALSRANLPWFPTMLKKFDKIEESDTVVLRSNDQYVFVAYLGANGDGTFEAMYFESSNEDVPKGAFEDESVIIFRVEHVVDVIPMGLSNIWDDFGDLRFKYKILRIWNRVMFRICNVLN